MIDFIQNTIDGVMIGSSYALLALGFTLIFGVMRRLNLSYGPSIMLGAYLGTLLHVQFGAGAGGGRRRDRRSERRSPASMWSGCALRRWRRAPASPRWCRASRSGCSSSRPPSCCCRATPMRFRRSPTGAALTLGPFLLRADQLVDAVPACWSSTAAVHLGLYRSRFGLALRAIIDQPMAAHLVGVRRQAGDVVRLRGRLRARRHRRLSRARGRSAGHADVRHVGDPQGPHRHDDRRARIDPRRGGRRPVARPRSRRTANGTSGRSCAISSPTRSCSASWCCGRADCSAPPRPRDMPVAQPRP